MYKTICFVFVCILLMSFFYQEIEAVSCCHPSAIGMCNDLTTPTPFCGVGPCNWLGCNCKGGCR